jgi:3-oxoacyl-[acyl-carrier-protein] synthase II
MLGGRSAFVLEAGFAETPVPVGKVTRDLAPLLPAGANGRAARCVQLGLPAAHEALKQAGLFHADGPLSIGMILGSGLGGLDFHEEMIAKAIEAGMRAIHPFTIPKVMPSALGAWIAELTGITGPNLCISTACSSSANAVAEGYWKIRTGQWDMALVGGAEAPLSPFTYNAYRQMKVVSRSLDPAVVVRPFHPDRDGFILAEGAAFMVLESPRSAEARKAVPLAWLGGAAQNSGAHHPVAPKPDASDIAAAMREALRSAALEADAIDGICVHGTGTRKNDEAEYLGMKAVFGDRLADIPLFAPKSQTGHTLGACGILESVLCVLALGRQVLPQAFLLGECMSATAPSNREGGYRHLMNNSFGFGSNNVSLVFRRAGD